MRPIAQQLRRGFGVALAATLALPLSATAAEPFIDASALEAEQAWINPLWRAVRGPTGPYLRAAFEAELARAEVADEALEADDDAADADDEHGQAGDDEEPESPETSADDVPAPAWPHSVSIGQPNRGWLAYATELHGNDRLSVRPETCFGTSELIERIEAAAATVNARFPETPQLHIGDISRKSGGRLKRHKSHQSGRDADIGYYLRNGHDPHNLKHASPRNLDLPRTWTFMSSLLDGDNVEYLFVDRRLIRVLHAYARDVAKASPEQLDTWFGGKDKAGIIRHLRGHDDHMHVRVKAPSSIAAVREYVKRHGVEAIKPLPVYATVKRGDSLWKIAHRYHLTVGHLTKWNHLGRKKLLRPGQKLVIGWKRPRLPQIDT